VQIRRFAEQVLFGDTLQDKLLLVGRLEDDAPGPPIAVPAAPGRPADLPLRSRERPPFPSSERLGEVDAAATALHAFANHELLALELMALALLRFPDADPAFRADLARTLQEEQVHLRLYLARLDGWGRRFGAEALSAYFWDALRGVESPRSFSAAMGLTLEQANLDFAGHFARAFEGAGDVETARILRRVLADEIVHVARGLRWFDRLRVGPDRWEDWIEALPGPLTPRRARGPDFAAGPRLQAGLDPAFVERVRTAGGSRGRPPDVHWLNLPEEAGTGGRARAWMRDLEATAILRASHDDVVLVQRAPEPRWLGRLAEAGFALPEIVVVSSSAPVAIGGPVRSLLPWAATPEAVERLAPLGDVVPAVVADKVADGERLAELLSGLGPADRLLAPDALPRTLRAAEDVDAAVAAFRAAGHPRIVFKRPLGTAGQGQLRLFEPALSAAQRSWIEASLAGGPLRVEPWLDRRLDLSFQLDAGGLRGIVRFFADRTGRFTGAAIERPTAGLPADVARFWAGEGRDPGWVDGVGHRLADALRPAGPVGIDAFVYAGPEGLRLHPFVERNPRLTFGRLALDLRARLRPGCVGRWTILGPADLRRSGASSFAALDAALAAALPLERRGGLLARGCVPTSDPSAAQTALPVLVAAPSAAELAAALARVGLAVPS
jgi:uncharacterized ferritin-like protein (DUF455 family)